MSTAKNAFLDSINIRQKILNDPKFLTSLQTATTKLVDVVRTGGTIYSCGNGGSACDAMHLTEELVARYKKDRPGIKAHHLMDPGTLTCWSNDYEFNGVFERQVETFCGPKDALIVFTTSGNSENILRAIKSAKSKGTLVIGLLGKDGGKAAPLCDVSLIVPSDATERIQEIHITLVHILCEALE